MLERPLSYIGYGGEGLQVRDLLHVDDLIELIDLQLGDPDRWNGFVGNVGGGRAVSLSLLETTEICRELTGNEVGIGAAGSERPGDVPLYISDCSRLFGATEWRPRKSSREVLADILAWVEENFDDVVASLGLR